MDFLIQIRDSKHLIKINTYIGLKITASSASESLATKQVDMLISKNQALHRL